MQYESVLSFTKNAAPALITLGIWFCFYVVRRKFPAAWKLFFSWVPEDAGTMARTTLQGLPSVVIGSVSMSLYSGLDPKQAAWGAVAGACAPLLHHTLAAAPDRLISYHGALGEQVAGQGLDVAVGSESGQADTSETAPSGSDDR